MHEDTPNWVHDPISHGITLNVPKHTPTPTQSQVLTTDTLVSTMAPLAREQHFIAFQH